MMNTKAPSVTIDDIEDSIKGVVWFTAADGAAMVQVCENHMDELTGVDDFEIMTSVALSLLTFCVIELKNGFTVTGESACVSPENFDAEIGRKIAFENAKQKIWPLMGYALKNKLMEK